METVDEQLVRAPLTAVFELASDVEKWPSHLSHYRYVRFRQRRPDGGGLVEMSAYRPFHVIDTSRETPAIRFRHVGGITKGMEVEWTFAPAPAGTHVRIVHLWDGPRIPLAGVWAAKYVIGPVFVHGIACRTLAGLGAVAQREARPQL